ncbi:PREDICTED: motile sperm domain-containing protein 2-like [Priapulus caudatus]|uniref:Motile sperm domain-containing protein 2-like n=1 Tax=Priapulus caudatus TaxID=37621 RepID=A0ABM1F5N8_PRICU|nr:PREDICTED: motile sperm domain-containing protein 2-like [Priapulus caudatus]
MVHESLAWRRSFAIADVTDADLLQEHHDQGAVYRHGVDRCGRPLLWMIGRKHRKSSALATHQRRYLAAQFERYAAAHPGEQCVVLLDADATGMSHMDFDFISFLLACVKTYYPSIMAYILIYNLPWVLEFAWTIIKTWLHPKAVARVRFVPLKDVGQYVDEEQRPKYMGGSDEYVYKYDGPAGKPTPKA